MDNKTSGPMYWVPALNFKLSPSNEVLVSSQQDSLSGRMLLFGQLGTFFILSRSYTKGLIRITSATAEQLSSDVPLSRSPWGVKCKRFSAVQMWDKR